MSHISLLHWYLCLLNIFLDVQTFPHTSQGRETPSRCLISMWSLMATNCPSFPHTLHVDALLPFEEMFWLLSIKDFTFASNSWTSLGTQFWTDSALDSILKWTYPARRQNCSFLYSRSMFHSWKPHHIHFFFDRVSSLFRSHPVVQLDLSTLNLQQCKEKSQGFLDRHSLLHNKESQQSPKDLQTLLPSCIWVDEGVCSSWASCQRMD